MRSPDASYKSPGLQRVLNVMRTNTTHGKFVLLVQSEHRRWQLGRTTCTRGEPIEVIDGYTFDNRLEAERTVFKLRWLTLTGVELEL